ncbi:MAG: DEAD/DEAH box helicase [Planctomycetes bacterium]|nr:DEAD/DEAH box helicase [Planctomycetota bacterium]
MPFKTIGLCDGLVQGILATGYTAPTEIQAEAIPVVIAGKDMIGCAQTGTGKTAAFVLPILNKIANTREKTKRKILRSLIITPTRELAVQIDRAIQGYGRFINMSTIAVYGGTQIQKQTKVLKRGVDIIVATPGRLIDHIQRGNIDLSTVEILVLDEADRMLDMGFINDIKLIIKKIPDNRQTLLFSATMSKAVTNLTQKIQRSPKMIQIGKQHDPIETITQHIYPVAREQKMDLLLYMIDRQQMYSVLIFSRTKRGADKICRNLKKNKIKAEAIHSDRTQRQRMRAMDGFKAGKFQVMVATDIAARGINVEGISHVFNFDVPTFPEDYVHRIGRTGRAQATGDAITFVGYEEIPLIAGIERFIGRTFKDEYYEGFEYKTKLSIKRGPKGKPAKKGSSQRRREKEKRSPQTSTSSRTRKSQTSSRTRQSSPALSAVEGTYSHSRNESQSSTSSRKQKSSRFEKAKSTRKSPPALSTLSKVEGSAVEGTYSRSRNESKSPPALSTLSKVEGSAVEGTSPWKKNRSGKPKSNKSNAKASESQSGTTSFEKNKKKTTSKKTRSAAQSPTSSRKKTFKRKAKHKAKQNTKHR